MINSGPARPEDSPRPARFHCAPLRPCTAGKEKLWKVIPVAAREGVALEVVLPNGRLAAPRPGAHPVRPLAYSALVAEDNRAPFGLDFLMVGIPRDACDGWLPHSVRAPVPRGSERGRAKGRHIVPWKS
jgi:hypothetical protein